MAAYSLRYLGDPVLKETTPDVTDIDGRLVEMVDDMFEVLYDASGLALAAPQVGIRKRLFVYDYRDTPGVLINPVIEESGGEWSYIEGCLSIPGIYFEITRPKQVNLTGLDLEGNEVVFAALDCSGVRCSSMSVPLRWSSSCWNMRACSSSAAKTTSLPSRSSPVRFTCLGRVISK